MCRFLTTLESKNDYAISSIIQGDVQVGPNKRCFKQRYSLDHNATLEMAQFSSVKCDVINYQKQFSKVVSLPYMDNSDEKWLGFRSW